ncbi:MAG: hemerythrin domain-containing protein [Deltaproteobacteria bacterium]|nr:hemerythrin domain-containing protein [Deltaproteobacteria bacterium]
MVLTLPREITGGLAREHRALLEEIERCEQAAHQGDLRRILQAVRFLSHNARQHQRKEEEVLFPALERDPALAAGATRSLRAEHEEERRLIELVQDAVDAAVGGQSVGGPLRAGVQRLTALMRDHIRREDTLLFPLVERTLSPREATRVRAAMDAIGYFAACEAQA